MNMINFWSVIFFIYVLIDKVIYLFIYPFIDLIIY